MLPILHSLYNFFFVEYWIPLRHHIFLINWLLVQHVYQSSYDVAYICPTSEDAKISALSMTNDQLALWRIQPVHAHVVIINFILSYNSNLLGQKLVAFRVQATGSRILSDGMTFDGRRWWRIIAARVEISMPLLIGKKNTLSCHTCVIWWVVRWQKQLKRQNWLQSYILIIFVNWWGIFPSTTATAQSIRSHKEAVLNQWRSVTKTINKVWFTHLEILLCPVSDGAACWFKKKKRMLNFVKRDKNITRTRTWKSCKRAHMVYIYEIRTTWSFNGDDDACIYRWEISLQEKKSKTQVRSRSV